MSAVRIEDKAFQGRVERTVAMVDKEGVASLFEMGLGEMGRARRVLDTEVIYGLIVLPSGTAGTALAALLHRVVPVYNSGSSAFPKSAS